MSTYSNSTQQRYWSFTKEQLAHLRTEALQRYRSSRGDGDETEELSEMEERKLLYYYENRICHIASAFRFPNEVVATAITYFKRFYTRYSSMEDNPRMIAIGSLFLATKCEEAHTRVNDLAAQTQTTVERLVYTEQVLLDALHFQIKVHHPLRAIRGVIRLLTDMPKAALKELEAKAEELVMTSLFTDNCFIYTPSQIALSCLRQAANSMKSDAVQKLLHSKFSSETGYESLVTALFEIERNISAVSSLKLHDEAIGRLKFKRDQCSNPLRNPDSEEFKERQLKLETERDDHRRSKSRKLREKQKMRLDAMAVDQTANDDDTFVIRSNLKRRPRS